MTDNQTRAYALDEAAELRRQGEELFRRRVSTLHANGLNDTAIAARLGCSLNRVAVARQRLGLGRNAVVWAGL